MEKKRVQVLEELKGLPSCVYGDCEELVDIICNKSDQFLPVKKMVKIVEDTTIYTFYFNSEKEISSLNILVSPKRINISYKEVVALVGGHIDGFYKESDCLLENGKWQLESRENLVGTLSDTKEDFKFGFAYEDTRISRTRILEGLNYISKTKNGINYVRFNLNEERLIESFYKVLSGLAVWGFPNEKYSNITPLEMRYGELVEKGNTLEKKLVK